MVTVDLSGRYQPECHGDHGNSSELVRKDSDGCSGARPGLEARRAGGLAQAGQLPAAGPSWGLG